MNPVRDSLLQDLDGITPVGTQTPFYSTVIRQAAGRHRARPGILVAQRPRAGALRRRPGRCDPGRPDDPDRDRAEPGAAQLPARRPPPGRHARARHCRPCRAASRTAPRFRRIAGHAHVAGHDISGASMFDGPMSPGGPAPLPVAAGAPLVRADRRGDRHHLGATGSSTARLAPRQRARPLVQHARSRGPIPGWPTTPSTAHPSCPPPRWSRWRSPPPAPGTRTPRRSTCWTSRSSSRCCSSRTQRAKPGSA